MKTFPFYKVAQEWLLQVEKERKLSKRAKQAVLSFAIWLDQMIRNQDLKEEMEKKNEN